LKEKSQLYFFGCVRFSVIFVSYLLGFFLAEWLSTRKFDQIIHDSGGSSAWGMEYIAIIAPWVATAIVYPVLCVLGFALLYYLQRIERRYVPHVGALLLGVFLTPLAAYSLLFLFLSASRA
jgi:hypothetical protein